VPERALDFNNSVNKPVENLVPSAAKSRILQAAFALCTALGENRELFLEEHFLHGEGAAR
jgi:hypothetical protein